MYNPSIDVEKAWGTEYRGEYPRLLLDNICNMSKSWPQPVQPYAKQVAIIQSSGTGKSRMVHELSKLIFTILFNLRLGDESRGVREVCILSFRSHLSLQIIEFAFPRPDNAIHDYLNGENMTEKEYGRFFHAVFKTIGSVLEEKQAEIHKIWTGASNIYPRQRFATWWVDHLSTPGTRDGIYKRILDEINGTVRTMTTHSVSSSVPFRTYRMQRKLMESVTSLNPRLRGLLSKLVKECVRRCLAKRTI